MTIAVFLNFVHMAVSDNNELETVQIHAERLENEETSIVERAISLKRNENDKVMIIAAGTAKQSVLIREALAMGCDQGILITPTWKEILKKAAMEEIVSHVLEKIKFDVLMTGYRTLDGFSVPIGPQIAADMGIRFVGSVSKFTRNENAIECFAAAEQKEYLLNVSVPCVLSVKNEKNYGKMIISVSQIQETFKKELTIINDMDLNDLLESSARSLTESVFTYTREQKNGKKECLFIDEVPAEAAAQAMFEKLIERKII